MEPAWEKNNGLKFQLVNYVDTALGKMTNASSGKNSLANALAKENFPKQTASNAHAIEKENKIENKNTLPSFSRETQAWPKKPAELEAYRGEQQHQKEVHRDTNYIPSPELLAPEWANSLPHVLV